MILIVYFHKHFIFFQKGTLFLTSKEGEIESEATPPIRSAMEIGLQREILLKFGRFAFSHSLIQDLVIACPAVLEEKKSHFIIVFFIFIF